MKVGDLVKSIQPYADTKMGIILKLVGQRPRTCLNDLWLVHWFDENPFDEQVFDYDLCVLK